MKSEKKNTGDYRKLMRSFDRSAARVKKVLIPRYGMEKADNIIRKSRREYEAIIPHIPYIGNKNPFRIFLHT